MVHRPLDDAAVELFSDGLTSLTVVSRRDHYRIEIDFCIAYVVLG